MEPYVRDSDVTLYVADARAALAELEPECADLCVTSPPYFQLRDYGTEPQTWADGETCELGLERTPEAYVEHLSEIFGGASGPYRASGVWRSLAPWGSLFIVIDDTYAADRSWQAIDRKRGDVGNRLARATPPGIKPKDLMGVPWLLAFALRDAGWYWRATIVWDKPDAMPESARDRVTKSHEYVLHFSKSERYYWDRHAILEPHSYNRWGGNDFKPAPDSKYLETSDRVKGSGAARIRDAFPGAGRNARSVWRIATEDFRGAHFAVFSRDIARRPIRAGTSERGNCVTCGKPWERVISRSQGFDTTRPQTRRALELFQERGLTDAHLEAIRAIGMNDAGKAQVVQTGFGRNRVEMQRLADEAKSALGGYFREFLMGKDATLGWRPACRHYDERYFLEYPRARRARDPGREAWLYRRWRQRVVRRPGRDEWPTRPAVVLDPFSGAGTTPLVAREEHRHAIAVELSAHSAELIASRLRQLSLFG